MACGGDHALKGGLTRAPFKRHDGVNLARAFPGNARGSITQRLAHLCVADSSQVLETGTTLRAP